MTAADPNRYDEPWQAYICSDCDPKFADDPEYAGPYRMLVPHGEPVPDNCPRCGSYLSLCEESRRLKIAVEEWKDRAKT